MFATYSPYLFYLFVFVGGYSLSLLLTGLVLGLVRERLDDRRLADERPAGLLPAYAEAARQEQRLLAVSLLPLLVIAGLALILSLMPIGTLSPAVLLFALSLYFTPLLLQRGTGWQRGLALLVVSLLGVWLVKAALPPFPLSLLMAGGEPALALRQLCSAVLLLGFGLFFFIQDKQERVGLLSAGYLAIGLCFLLVIVELCRALALVPPPALIEPQPLFAAIGAAGVASSSGIAAGALLLGGVCLGASFWMRPFFNFALSRGGRLVIGLLLGWHLLEGAWLIGPLPILVLLLLPLAQLMWRAGWKLYSRRGATGGRESRAASSADKVGSLSRLITSGADGWQLPWLIAALSLIYALFAGLAIWQPLTGFGFALLFTCAVYAALLWLATRRALDGATPSEPAAAE